MQKIVGITLILSSLLLYVTLFSITIQYSLFIAMVTSMPVFYIVLFGCSLILKIGFKRAVLWCILFTALTILPWIIVLPLNYQVLSYIILVFIFFSILMRYRRKLFTHVNKKEELKGEKFDFR